MHSLLSDMGFGINRSECSCHGSQVSCNKSMQRVRPALSAMVDIAKMRRMP